MNQSNYHQCSRQAGIVILLAVLLVSIVLVVSLSLLNIVFKQLVLSATARESQLAFFAADGGHDCARYWDIFANLDSSSFPLTNPVSLTCGNQAITTSAIGNSSTFYVSFGTVERPTCAAVTVTKTPTANPTIFKTRIISSGRNIACSAWDTPTNRTVERAVESSY